MKRMKTKFTGVYERESEKKFKGKPDVCFDIAYRHDGKLVWEKIGRLSEGYSAVLADQVRSERLRTMRHSEELPKQKVKAPLFKDVCDKYKSWASNNKSSYHSDISRIDTYLIPMLGNSRLDAISPFQLEKVKSELTHKGLAPASVAHCLKLIRQIYNKALVWRLYKGENPVKGVKMPTLQNQRERFLSYDEAKLLLKTLGERSRNMHDMAVISLQCGLRAGEIFNLKGQHIDLDNGLITVADPKNKQARKAYMTNAVKDILKSRIAEKEDYLFLDRVHKGKINSISRRFAIIVDSLGFNDGVEDARQKVTFHTLRHTFASWLALGGESLLTIRELLGHKSFEMTKRYAHLVPDEKRKATLRLESAFNGTSADVITINQGE